MVELDERTGTAGVDHIGEEFEIRYLGVVVQREAGDGDAPLGNDARGLDHHGSHTGLRTRTVVHEVPGVRTAELRPHGSSGVLAHRGHDESVRQVEPAYGQGLEQEGAPHGDHLRLSRGC